MELLLQAVVQGVLVGATYALIALGAAVVYNVSGVLNMAHGDFVSVAMYISLSLFAAWKLDPYVSLLITFPVLFILGALAYRYLIRPVLGKHVTMVVQLTLGLMFILQNSLLIAYGGRHERVPSAVAGKLIMLGDFLPLRWSTLISFATAAVLATVLYWMLTRTDFGRSIRAIHQNARAAALMGVNVERVRMLTFGLGIAFLAIAGALLTPDTNIHPGQGLRYTVTTLIILILGGMGDFAGVLLGGLLIGVAEAIGSVYISGTLGFLLPYLVFVLVLLFRPQGLVGRQSHG